MTPLPEFTLAGLFVGVLYGVFGVGGSSFATPVFGLLGVPGLMAIATPLPATMAAAVAGAGAYARRREVDWLVAKWCIVGGFPGTIGGALASRIVGGKPLLVASGVVLAVVAVRVLWPTNEEKRLLGRARRKPGLVIPATFIIGVFTGLLANGGGFLLVPLYVVVLGLTMPESAGTSLVVIATLSLPTLVTHWTLGHIDWPIAGAFALGAVPGTLAGTRLTQRISTTHMRKAFGVLLLAFAVSFLARELR